MSSFSTEYVRSDFVDLSGRSYVYVRPCRKEGIERGG